MSKITLKNELDRRQFLKIIPACSLVCLGSGGAWALAQEEKTPSAQEAKHKFDNEMDRKLTYRQLINMQYREFIQLAKALEKEMGKEKFIEFLKKHTYENLIKIGQQYAKRSPENSFKTYTNTFRPPRYKNTLTMEIVEDTEKAFELKVTECIWASVFHKAEAGDIGFAYICYGDYAHAEGFNPKIKMIRDKTLMQGHKYCNHRYIWEG
ncbi:MAG: hypothetical protein GTO17_02360 [Candidatus Aminicenantes bacterium]|nr:hypothetical protein [Candidatus Aminicenantes bacterium]